MSTSVWRNLLVVATLINAFAIGTSFGVKARAKAPRKAMVILSIANAEPLSQRDRDVARAVRIRALEDANDASWAAFVIARREPKKVLKNIPLTESERQATHHIGTRYLDRFEILDRDDKNSRGTLPYTSTLLRDIAVLRLQQRADLRKALTREKRVQFDTNVMSIVATSGGVDR